VNISVSIYFSFCSIEFEIRLINDLSCFKLLLLFQAKGELSSMVLFKLLLSELSRDTS